MKKKWRPVDIAVIALIAGFFLAAAATFFFADRLVSFAINNFTGYHISYVKWGESPLDRRVIFYPSLDIKDKGITIKAVKADIALDLPRVIRDRQIALQCSLTDVSFSLGSGSSGEKEDILSAILGSGRVFSHISFSALADGKELYLSSLRVESDDIRVEGEYHSTGGDDYVSLDIKISISPAMASMMAGDIRSGVFSPDEDGWHSVVIDYKGNPLFLKALYLVTSG